MLLALGKLEINYPTTGNAIIPKLALYERNGRKKI
jgi:hypothetical protein